MAIRILSEQVANRIAAGEVVERPASIVKELLENSIDANATKIKVEIKGGGVALIEVSDNGDGIAKQDLPLVFKRHATSKLPKEDLTHIETLGFRGEALASIASVSEAEVVSNRSNQKGWRFSPSHKEPSPDVATNGTKITIKRLFYHQPVRLKFLKNEKVEFAHIQEIFIKAAIANPHIAMTLTSPDHRLLVFDANTSKLHRTAALLGKEFPANSLPLLYRAGEFVASGWCSIPTYHRRGGILSFVNGRSVREPTIIAAIKDAYGDTLTRGKMPAVALFLECPAAEIDVNVHPAKTEIRFQDKRKLYQFIFRAISEVLTRAPLQTDSTKFHQLKSKITSPQVPSAQVPQAPPSPYQSPPFTKAPQFKRPNHFNPATNPETNSEAAPSPSQISLHQTAPNLTHPNLTHTSQNHSNQANPQANQNEMPHIRILGQIHSRYILAEDENGLVIIDQHAAAERLIYEKLKQGLKERLAVQVLLTPLVVHLAPVELENLLAHSPHLLKLGLVIEKFGNDAVAVRQVAALIKNGNLERLIQQLASLSPQGYTDDLEKSCSLMACHGAIRGKTPMNETEMLSLINQMRTTPKASQCNHGRPALINLKTTDLDKLFER